MLELSSICLGKMMGNGILELKLKNKEVLPRRSDGMRKLFKMKILLTKTVAQKLHNYSLVVSN